MAYNTYIKRNPADAFEEREKRPGDKTETRMLVKSSRTGPDMDQKKKAFGRNVANNKMGTADPTGYARRQETEAHKLIAEHLGRPKKKSASKPSSEAPATKSANINGRNFSWNDTKEGNEWGRSMIKQGVQANKKTAARKTLEDAFAKKGNRKK